MAEFHFYGSQQDSNRLLERILETGDFWLAADHNYASPEAMLHARMTSELLETISTGRRFYVGGPFSKAPLVFREIKGGTCAGGCYIDQFRGGPFLSLSLPMCKKVDGITWHLGPGNLFCRPYYWDDAKNQRVKPSTEITLAYAHLVRVIKAAVAKCNINNNTVWIGNDGLLLLEREQALILAKGKWITLSGDVVKSNALENQG